MRVLRRLASLLSLGVLLSFVGCGGGGGGGASSDSRLAGVALSAGTLVPTFEPGVADYTVEVDCAVASVAVTPVAQAGFTTITVNGTAVGSGVPSAAIALAVAPASNLIEILVTAPDGGSTSRYRITYTRLSSSELASLVLSAGTLTPAFTPGHADYLAIVEFTVATMAVTSQPIDPGATLEVNGVGIAAGVASAPTPLAINPVTNTFEVKVVASDGSTTTVYTITVIRLPDVRLTGLELSRGDLSPAFDATKTSYALAVGNLVPAITVKPTASDSAATLRLNGVPIVSGTASASLPLAIQAGGHPIDVEVTGSDGVTVVHTTIVATRRATLREDVSVSVAASTPTWNWGGALAIDGDTMVVGAPYESAAATGVDGNEADTSAGGAGAAYVFVRKDGSWSREAYLKASNTDAGDSFGGSVAISGDTIVIGAVSEASNATGVNGDEANDSAWGTGAAYVFVRANGSWTQEAYLKASNAGVQDYFGGSVAVSGDRVVVGARDEDSGATGVGGNGADNSAYAAGAAYVFGRSSGAWTEEAYLKASNARGIAYFGSSVAISGDTVVVGSPGEQSTAGGVNPTPTYGGSQVGAAYVFVASGGAWSQQAYLKPTYTGNGDQFGSTIAIAGDTLVVGVPTEDLSATNVDGSLGSTTSPNSGAAYVFARSGTTWAKQAYLKASNTGADDLFGGTVAVSGDVIVVGAPFEDSGATGVGGNGADESQADAGAAYVFVRSGSTWSPRAYVKGSTTGAGTYFGSGVGVSIDTLAVVAPGLGTAFVLR